MHRSPIKRDEMVDIMPDIFVERHESHKQDYVEMWEGPHNVTFAGIDSYSEDVKVVFLVAREESGEEYPGFLAKRLMNKEYDSGLVVKSHVIRSTVYNRFLMTYDVMGTDGIMIFYKGKLVNVYNWRNRNNIESVLTRLIEDCADYNTMYKLVRKESITFDKKFEQAVV